MSVSENMQCSGHPQSRRIKQITLFICTLMLILPAACGQDDFAILCRGEGGDVEFRRPPVAQADRYCVFPDGTTCAESRDSEQKCVWKSTIIDSVDPFDLFWFQLNSRARSPLPSPLPVPTSTPSAAESPLPQPQVQYNPPVTSFLRAPKSLDALLHRAPLIIIGAVGPVERYTEFVPIGHSQPTVDADGNIVPSLPVINQLMPGAAMTEFRLVVDEVLRDDGTLAADKPIILRSTGHITADIAASSAGPVPPSFTGQPYLFLLTPYPDGQAYTFYYTTWSRLIIGDDDVLYRSNGERDPLILDENAGPVTLESFKRALEGD